MKPITGYLLRKILLMLLLSLLLCISVGAQTPPAFLDEHGRWENGVSERWWFPDSIPQEEIRKLIAQWDKIARENLSSQGNEWAGDYFIGDETHGEYLRWSPESGFVIVKVNKCAAQVEGFSYGKVASLPPVNRFIPDKVISSGHGHGHGQLSQTTINFVPVRFRNERLLIPETEMSEFGDYVAGRGTFNESHFIYYFASAPFFYHLGKTEAVATNGAPIVPPGYEKFLKKPIEAVIVKVNKRTVRPQFSYESPSGRTGVTYYEPVSITSVTVNVGKAAGVKPGMILRMTNTGEDMRIIRTGLSASTGIIIRSLDKSGRETFYADEVERVYPRVKAGWNLTTSPF
jgi:hypothetical protein